jgi:DNA-binding transcriptional regulator LsrR (DeoR family)
MPRPKRANPKPGVMLDAARLFAGHEDYQAIARQLRMNRRDVQPLMEKTVSWLLQQQAQLDRLRRVETVQDRLETKVLERFPHLVKVQIVPSGKTRTDTQYAALVHEWGRLAAEYLDRLTEDAERLEHDVQVGVSGGETVLEVMSQLPERDRPEVHFHAVALIGHGKSLNSFHVGPEANVTIAWSRSGRMIGTCHYATVQPYSHEIKKLKPDERRSQISDDLNELWRTDAIKEVIIGMKDLDIVFAGLGVVDPGASSVAFNPKQTDRFTMTGILNPVGIGSRELAAEGAVGDICCCLFNADGDEQPKDARGRNLPKERWRFFLSAGYHDPSTRGLNFYKKLVSENKTVVVIAGVNKEPAIRAALKGRLFNYWITDDETAREIVEAR